jgi:predicted GNAT family N-acyltransferase
MTISYDSLFYQKELELRDAVLRHPIGLSIAQDDLSRECYDRHYGLVENDELLACLIITGLDNFTVQLRQMAVAEVCRGRGLGFRLVSGVEKVLQSEGIRKIVLNARRTAEKFYEKCGYQVVGEEYIKIGLPHINMEKLIL